jgi:type VI secretion system secreted protein VgrG
VTDRRSGTGLAAKNPSRTSNNAGMRPGSCFSCPTTAVDASRHVVAWHRPTRTDIEHLRGLSVDASFPPAAGDTGPRIHGCQTAKVVGKSGEEIWTDQAAASGEFHWDRGRHRRDEFVLGARVAGLGRQRGRSFSRASGRKWDQLSRGRSRSADHHRFTNHNAQQTVPYALPDNQTRSVIRPTAQGRRRLQRDPVRRQERRRRAVRAGAEGHERQRAERSDGDDQARPDGHGAGSR